MSKPGAKIGQHGREVVQDKHEPKNDDNAAVAMQPMDKYIRNLLAYRPLPARAASFSADGAPWACKRTRCNRKCVADRHRARRRVQDHQSDKALPGKACR